MSKKYYYKDQKVRGHKRTTPKSKKRIEIKPYDRKQKFRKYDNISKAKAQELFDKKSQRSKTMDLKSTSKKVFDTPNEYWEQYMSKSDVKGIDTKENKSQSKQNESKKVFIKINLEDLEKNRNAIDDKIIDIREKIMDSPLDSPEYKKADQEFKHLLDKKDEIEIQIYNEKYLKGNNIEEILQKGDIKKIDHTASVHLLAKHKKRYLEIDLAHKKISSNLKVLSTSEVELYNLKKWKREGLEVSKKEILSKENEQKELKNKIKQSFEDLKKNAPKFKVDVNEFEKELALLNKNKHRFFDKDEELPIIDMGSGYFKDCYTGKFAVMDSLRISLLATDKGYKGIEGLYDSTKYGKNIYLDEEDTILTSSGNFLYKINNSQYPKERVDKAIKGFGKDQSIDVLFTNEAPLIIRNKDLVHITAPRFSEKEVEDITLDYNKKGKTPRYGYEDIKISQEDFNRIKKSNTKKELIEKANLPKEYSKYNKNELIYHYIIEQKTSS